MMVKSFLLYITCMGFLFSCNNSKSNTETRTNFLNLSDYALIPKVKEVVDSSRSLRLTNRISIEIEGTENKVLSTLIESEWPDLTESIAEKNLTTELSISLDQEADYVNAEGYRLTIESDGIRVIAKTKQGAYRAWQTLRQLLLLNHSNNELPTGTIMDHPEYIYRGAMLDVARHFFSVDEVKLFIDQLDLYKINYLHLHLSDDQGWRIHINKWPKLTEIGSQSQVDGGEAGFYTQQQYQELISYAAERHITIVPEIDMPGHTNAALASYAELNCDNKQRELYYGREVGFSSLCVGKPEVYQFAEDVIRELALITPGPYIHIGGDETHATEEVDYIEFMNTVVPMVEKYGKSVLGWDEISSADIPQNTIVQYWAEENNALRAIEKQAKVLMSPASYSYLDMKYDSLTPIGYNWAGYISVERGYDWEPTELVEGIDREHIIGIESPLWSETIKSSDDIEYLAFPRLLGYSEIGWAKPNSRDWSEYAKRLVVHGALLERLGIDFYKDPAINWSSIND